MEWKRLINLILILTMCAFLTLACPPAGDDGTEGEGEGEGEGGSEPQPYALNEIKFWGYQIGEIDNVAGDAVDKLVASKYDMLVIEPTRTDWDLQTDGTFNGSPRFDTKGMVQRLKESKASDGVHRKLVIAYIDIGEAEDWRWYWDPNVWTRETEANRENCDGVGPLPEDWPSWIVARDPDCFGGNYPVAYWEQEWKDIVINGTNFGSDLAARDYNSIIDEVIKDGFDGIYLDWVEGFENEPVMAAAQAAGVDPVQEMVKFIEEMRVYTKQKDPNFLIIQQNAAALIFGGEDNRERIYADSENDFENVEDDIHWELLDAIDGIAQEGVWYDGFATEEWEDCAGFDNNSDMVAMPPTEEYLDDLETFYLSEGRTVFTCEYAHNAAADAYTKSKDKGFIPYATHRTLTRLTDTPPPEFPGEGEPSTTDCP